MLRLSVVAHAKWFVDWSMPFPTDWRFMLHPASVAAVAGAVAVAVAWAVTARQLDIPHLPGHQLLTRLRPWLPRLVAASLGVSLIALAVTHAFLAPHQSLQQVPGGWGIAIIEGLVGVWLISAVRLRQAAAAVGLLGVIGLVLQGPVAMLEAGHMWGIAWFLWVAAQPHQAGATAPCDGGLGAGVLGLRLGVGVGFIAGALSEKLMNPAITAAILDAYHAMDLAHILGLGWDTATVIRLGAAIEILFALLLMSGVTPRLVVCVAAVSLVATVPVFGRTELFGHLPFYGVLLALLVCGSTGPRLFTNGLRGRTAQPGRRADVRESIGAQQHT